MTDEIGFVHRGQAIRIRPWHPADAGPLADAANHADVAQWLDDRFPHPYTPADAQAFLQQVVPESDELLRAIEVEDRIAGGIGLRRGHGVRRRSAELGYWLTPAFWRRGIMAAVIDHCLPTWADDLDLVRVCSTVYAANTASMRLLEHCRFRHEGTLRRAVCKHGRILDAEIYAWLPERAA